MFSFGDGHQDGDLNQDVDNYGDEKEVGWANCFPNISADNGRGDGDDAVKHPEDASPSSYAVYRNTVDHQRCYGYKIGDYPEFA